MDDSPRHVVIGGGTAGILLTYQLIRKGCRVALIERGSIETKNDCKPDYWTYLCNEEVKAPAIRSITQPHLYNRSIKYPTGTGLGGSSNVNAMLHDMGHRAVFERYWPKAWKSEIILQYEQILDQIVPNSKIETFGWIKEMIEGGSNLPPHQLFDHSEGGRGRWTHRSLLQEEWIKTGRLTIIQQEVKHIRIVDNVAVSVVFSSGEEVCPLNSGEIILCAGTFGTPQILFHSGIKSIHQPNTIIKSVDIGENLQDHPLLGTFFFSNWQKHWPANKPLPPNGVHGAVYLDEKGSILDLKASSSTIPKCQILFMDGRIAAGLVDMIIPNIPTIALYNNYLRPFIVVLLQFLLHLSLFQWFFSNVCCLNIACLQPTSRGRLIIHDNGKMDIDCQLGASEEDQRIIRNGFITAKAIINASKQKCFDNLLFEVLPGPLFLYASGREAFQRYLKTFLLTYFHPVGTCSMDHYNERGEEVLGVVDSNLRLRTIKNLRIADASVIPHIPSFPIAKAVMIIALIAAEKLCEGHVFQIN